MTKHRRKVVAIVVTIAMVLMTMGTAFATDNTDLYEESANVLHEYGVLVGDNGDLMLDQPLKRQDAVIISLRFMGIADEEFENYEYISDFSDISDSYYLPIIGMAQDLGLVEGMGDGTFGFDQLIKAQDVQTLLLRSLGYEITDDVYPQVPEMAEELGIAEFVSADKDDHITRDKVAQLMLNTLNTEVNGEEQTLGEVLGYSQPVEPTLSNLTADEETSTDGTATITGSVEPTDATVTVAGNEAQVNEDGTFSADVELTEGSNTIEVMAENGDLFDAQEVTVEYISEYEISAEVATEDSIEVTFNHEVQDTNAVEFTLEGDFSVETDVSWNDENTIATLTTPSVLAEGTYTITASGLTFAEDKDSATVSVAENGIATIEITSDKLIQVEGTDNATLNYKLLDNYGTDITEDTISESDLTVAASKSLAGADEFDIDADNGKMTLKFQANELDDTDNVAITLIASNTGAATSKTLEVADPAQIDEVTLNEVTFPEDTTQLLTGESEAAYVTLDSTDQYGNAVNSKSDFDNDVLLISSDSSLSLTSEEYTDDNEDTKVRLVVDTTGISTDTSASITAVSKYSGKSSSLTLDIQKPAEPDQVTIGSLESIVAASDPAGTLVLPITVLDQYGEQLSADEIAANAGDFTVSGTDALNGNLEIATSGDNKGKIVNNAQLGATEGTAVITVSTSTSVDTYTLEVNEAAYEKTIRVNSDPAENLLMDATTKMNFKFFDQYGRLIESPDAGTVVNIEVSDANVIKASDSNSNTATSNPYASDASVLAATDALTIETVTDEGTAKVTAELEKDSTVISTAEASVEVTAGVPGELTFAVENIPTLVAIDGAAGTVDGNDKYARPIKLTATDEDGNTFAIPDSRILDISVSSDDLLVSSGTVDGNIAAQDDYYVVGVDALANCDFDSDADSKTETITLIISTDDGVKEVTKDVTISKEQPKVVDVVFAYDAATTGAQSEPVDTTNNPYELTEDGEEITEISGTLAEINDHEIYVYEVDQYGVYSKVTPATFEIVNDDRMDGDTIGYDDPATNTLSDISANDIADELDVHIMHQASNGVYGTFVINTTEGASDLDLVDPEVTSVVFNDESNANAGTIDSDDTITIEFSEAVDPTSIDAGLTAGGSITDTLGNLLAKVGSFGTPYAVGTAAEDGSSTLELSSDGTTVTITTAGFTSDGSETNPDGAFTPVGTITDEAANAVDTSVTPTASGSF